MRKRNIIIFATTITLATLGVAAKVNRKKSENFSNYVRTYSDSITDDDFYVTAHRGFSSLEVENTAESISLAADKDYVDYIEIDARLTKDNEIVLSHNNALTCDRGLILVSETSLKDIDCATFTYISLVPPTTIFANAETTFVNTRKKELGQRKYHLASLKEGIKCCGDKKIIIDLKFNNDVEKFSEILIKEFEGINTDNIIFQSLNIDGIKYLQEHSDFTCMALISSETDLKRIDEFERIGIRSSLLNEEVMNRLISSKKEIAVWTINSTKELERIIELAGDNYKNLIYITDYPDLIATKLDEQEKVLKKSK